ncbi:Hypothetical predicted protein [Pelobates cultripes]|uniref:Uncharacterized protein n=1 Tax=Pelobates cultripes TaxID=61616 RepID=A0AAD1T0D3_PELCU|nr:Hypothetical predicted protein [Pelobates cultripes]
MTAHRLHRIFPTVPAECWQCSTEEGTMPHLWWHCSGIQPLWEDVRDLLESLGIRVFPMTITTCLLLLFPREVQGTHKQLIALILMAARNLIALNWKKHTCPSLQQLKDKVQQFYVYERMSTNTAHFREVWGVWETWYNGGEHGTE